MIRALMESALNGRVIVLGTALALVMAGVYSFANLDIEAYPDPVQPMVEVLAQPGGLSAEEVEKLVTVPLEIGLAGMRDLEAMRSISLFGLSDIRAISPGTVTTTGIEWRLLIELTSSLFPRA
jgi:cobalt-zinc-cadmium resistance protein CzcA